MGVGGCEGEERHSKLRLNMDSSRHSGQFNMADCGVRGRRQEAGQMGLKLRDGSIDLASLTLHVQGSTMI